MKGTTARLEFADSSFVILEAQETMNRKETLTYVGEFFLHVEYSLHFRSCSCSFHTETRRHADHEIQVSVDFFFRLIGSGCLQKQ